MTILVLQNNSQDRIGRLIVPCLDYCRDRGVPFVDRSLTADFDPDALDFGDGEGVIIYGSVGWMKRFKDSRHSRWVHYDPTAFAASVWAPVFGDMAFNGPGRGWLDSAVGVGQALSRGDKRLHVRPDRDDKAFPGGVFNLTEWEAMISDRSALIGVDLSRIECWVSPVRDITAEIRVWIVDGEVVGASYYRRDGGLYLAPVHDQGLLDHLAAYSKTYLPCATVVMDIAFDGAESGVLEFNPIHSSGWYAVDVGAVIDAWAYSENLAATTRQSWGQVTFEGRVSTDTIP